MELDVLPDANAACRRASAYIAERARAGATERGAFTLGLSGGHSGTALVEALAAEAIPWAQVHVLQVDERLAPDGNPARNLTAIEEILYAHTPIEPAQVHAMAVNAPDPDAAAARYAEELAALTGTPPALDLVHLGLGADGHTASLVPGDAALAVRDRDVVLTAPYQGRRRMTLTYPALNRAHDILWLVTGEAKAEALALLCAGDQTIPAGRVRRDRAHIFADTGAASRLDPATADAQHLRIRMSDGSG